LYTKEQVDFMLETYSGAEDKQLVIDDIVGVYSSTGVNGPRGDE